MADGAAGVIPDLEGSTSASQEVDNAGLRCDSTITPIYPVRYAYANFFDSITAPSAPPSISTLLGASTVSAGNGYVVRLLRPGWIYIREEDNTQQLHIFKYTRSLSTSGSASERFEKYLFANGRNAHGGLVKDTSSGRSSYPFAFVAKGTTDVSMAYSEHEWHPNVIQRLQGSASERAKAMQRVNIAADSSEHAIIANSENLGKLVEDYRQRQDRALALSGGGSTAQLTLDVLTTEASYSLTPDSIAAQIQERLCYGETAKLVALHDPLGRQKEIAQAHAKIAIWEQDYSSQTLYPYMIGQLCQGFLDSDVADVKEAAQENLNIPEHAAYWAEMDLQHRVFAARRAEFADLFRAFMFPGSGLVDDVGTLDSYFKYFFEYAPGDQDEITKLADASAGIFEGLMASKEGREALEDAIEHAHANETDVPWNESKNVYGVIYKMVTAMITQPATDVDWKLTTAKSIDKLLAGLGVALGRIRSDGRYAAQVMRRQGQRLTPATMAAIADDVVPALLKVFGIEINGTQARLSADEIGRIVGSALEAQINGNGIKATALLQNATARVEVGQRMLDWSASTSANANSRLMALDEVAVTRSAPHNYNFGISETNQTRVGILFDTSFTGLSAFFNIMTITSIINSSEYDTANPLSKGTRVYDAVKLTSAISALTVDLMGLAHAGMRAGSAVAPRVLASQLATKLVPALTTRAATLGRLLAGRLASGLIAIANLAGAIVSTWEAVNAARQGNYGAAAGHAMVALGSAVLFFGAASYFLGGAAASGSTGIGLPVAVVCVVLALIVGGVGLIFMFEKNPVEQLLFQCFWGKSNDYAFWNQVSSRPAIQNRIDQASNLSDPVMSACYQIELQEFMNMVAMPSMALDRFGGSTSRRIFGNSWFDDRSYDITFTLPQFQPGTSDIIAGVYTSAGFDEYGNITTSVNSTLTAKLATAFQSALAAAGNSVYAEGVLRLNLRVDFGQRANILWVYNPMPNVFTPMRMLTTGGQLTDPRYWKAGMINDAVR